VLRRSFDWLFRNRITGAVTIAQFPNLALLLFGMAYATQMLVRPGGTAGFLLAVATRLFLAWWAADELLRGVNPWRRILGVGVLAYLAATLLWASGPDG
jgi:hypothetical protein